MRIPACARAEDLMGRAAVVVIDSLDETAFATMR
jgi:hypothetical protein